MNYLARLSWPAGSLRDRKSRGDVDIGLDDLSNSDDSQLRLPGELWRKVIGYTIRLAGANTIDLEDPFSLPYIDEEYPEVDPGIFGDRKSLSLVNSTWHAAVREISAEYLVVYSGSQLAALVDRFEADKPEPSDSQSHKSNWTNAMYTRRMRASTSQNPTPLKRLGEWTTRIDFKILGPYNTQHVLRLLQCVPNLKIYLNKNGPFDNPERPTPIEVIRGLITHNARSLRRVEWAGAGESPRYADLVRLCNHLPHLTTLRLVAIHSYPIRKSVLPPLLILPNLKNLSLGPIPEPEKFRAHYCTAWDPFLQYLCLSPHTQLPSLKRVDCHVFPVETMQFFYIHGHKLRFFRTTAWSTEDTLPYALDSCPNLETLVLLQGSESMAFPSFHPTLSKICIYPGTDVPVDVPERVFDNAVMSPLDSLLKKIEQMIAPHLTEIRVRNVGAYTTLCEYPTWLRFWWLRWNIRGVQFLDKTGKSYLDVFDPNEALLNLVRC